MKLKQTFILSALTFILFCTFSASMAQGWQTISAQHSKEFMTVVRQTPDLGFLSAGIYQPGASPILTNPYFVKTNHNGDIQWTKEYGDATKVEIIYDMITLPSGGYLAAGRQDGNVVLLELNSTGDTVGTHYYPMLMEVCGLTATDNGFIIAGANSPSGGGSSYMSALAVDSLYDTLWTTQSPTVSGGAYGSGLAKTGDGNYIVYYKRGSTPMFYKFSNTGAFISDGFAVGTFVSNFLSGTLKSTSDGRVVVGAHSLSPLILDPAIYILDSMGDFLWSKDVVLPNQQTTNAVCVTDDGGYALTGWDHGMDEAFVLRLDSAGNKLWYRTYKYSTYNTQGYNIEQIQGGGFIVTGFVNPGISGALAYILKTDSMGYVGTNLIEGNVFFDENENCIQDVGEIPLKGWKVKLEPGSEYTIVDSNGYYSFRVDSGQWQVSLVQPDSAIWQTHCPSSQMYDTLFDTNYYQTATGKDFAVKGLIDCPLLTVGVTNTGFLRPCRRNNYIVGYCNNGTDTAYSAYVEVTFDTNIIPLFADTPHTIIGNTVTVMLGDIPPLSCGSFRITDSVNCNSIINSTTCVSANIYPDSLCYTPSAAFDRSEIVVTGTCLGDTTVQFRIQNIGTGGADMDGARSYFVYEDDIVHRIGSFDLSEGQDSMIKVIVSADKTYTLIAEQHPSHPRTTGAQRHIELCGHSGTIPFPNPVITSFPRFDDYPPFDEDCQIINAAYDPNDKQAEPAGFRAQHYIKDNDVLEYRIRFQNTGNDTAFNIVLLDTLSPYVEPSSVVPGIGSHPYTFQMYGNNVIEFTFANIMLPDSNVSEINSHGFVKYTINQVANNPKNTVINNSAGIYFDFNAPVITNTTWHTIHDTTFIDLTTSIKNIEDLDIEINPYPNPFTEYVVFELPKEFEDKDVRIELVNLNGQVVNTIGNNGSSTIVMQKNNLSNGTYIYNIISNDKTIAKGKLIHN